MIKYDIEEIENFEKKVINDYDEVIEILNFFKDEEKNIFDTVNTPKSKKTIEYVNEYLNGVNNKTKDNQLLIKKEFNYIINNYKALYEYLKGEVNKL